MGFPLWVWATACVAKTSRWSWSHRWSRKGSDRECIRGWFWYTRGESDTVVGAVARITYEGLGTWFEIVENKAATSQYCEWVHWLFSRGCHTRGPCFCLQTWDIIESYRGVCLKIKMHQMNDFIGPFVFETCSTLWTLWWWFWLLITLL